MLDDLLSIGRQYIMQIINVNIHAKESVALRETSQLNISEINNVNIIFTFLQYMAKVHLEKKDFTRSQVKDQGHWVTRSP